jgi:hypothetical protein
MATDDTPKRFSLQEISKLARQANESGISAQTDEALRSSTSRMDALQKTTAELIRHDDIVRAALGPSIELSRAADLISKSSILGQFTDIEKHALAASAGLTAFWSSGALSHFAAQVAESPLLRQITDFQKGALDFEERFHRPILDMEALRQISVPLTRMSEMLANVEKSPFLARVADFQKTVERFEERFRLPLIEIDNFVKQHQEMISKIVERHVITSDGLYERIEAMQSPWIDLTRVTESLTGFASLQGIGHAVQTLPTYSHQLSDLLRSDLGDWRDQLTIPAEIASDIALRTDFYVEPSLTGFPAQAFGEGLDLSKLRSDPPPMVLAYGPPVPPSDDDEVELGLSRTNHAQDWLLRMETQLRAFIDRIMTDQHGPHWPKHRLPNGVYDKWHDKKTKAEQHGTPILSPIAYADFTDYMLVIGKADNWPYFARFFGRIEDIRESLQRLHPVRLSAAHARIISHEDQLYMYVEIRRIIRAIKKS